jgi:hypothetical protein
VAVISNGFHTISLRGARCHRLSSFSWTRDESYQGTDARCNEKTLPLFEIARLLVRLDHIAGPHRKRDSPHHVNSCKTWRARG